MTEDKTVRKLRKQLETALGKQKDVEAIEILGKLVVAEPKVPRWPHKRGELYRKHNRKKEAVDCYTLAADLYAEQGFIARAVAMAKTIMDIDPRATQVLERIDPEASRRLHRQQRPGALSARPAPHPAMLPEDDGPAHAAVLPDGNASAAARHPALLEDDGESSSARHPALLPDDDEPSRHPAVLPEDARSLLEADERNRVRAAPPPARGGSRVRAALKRQAEADELSSAPPPPPPPAAPPPIPGAARAQRPQPPGPAGNAVRVPGPPRLPEFSESVLDLAEELTIAPDAKPNETRFSDAPPARALKLDLTDLELKPRKAAPPGASLRPAQPTARTLSQLPLFPLFAEVPQPALIDMVKGSEVLELKDGAVVMRRGDPADALYGIVEGSVDVVVPGQQTKMTLAEGDVFGESCLLPGEKRHADVIVRGHLLGLKIPRAVFNQIVGTYPRLAEVLLELLTRRLLGNLLQSAPLFQEFDARGRQELAQRFEIRRAPRGTLLAQIGKMMDGLYINLTGRLEVMYADGRAGELHESGTMFGQSSLLTHEPSDVTVRAMAHMLLLRLPADGFHKIAMQYPGLLAQISDLASSSVAKVST
jgi:CRP-like cAMP-binding protein